MGNSSALIAVAFGIALTLAGCAASRQEVVAHLGSEYIGKNVDTFIMNFGPPASAFKMNSGDMAYSWQLGNETSINTDRGVGIAATRFCKVSVVASRAGIVTHLTTEDANAGPGLIGSLGGYGSICANRLGIRSPTR